MELRILKRVREQVRQQFELEQLDPLGDRLLRVLRVGYEKGLAGELASAEPRPLARLVGRYGLNVSSLHTVGALLYPDRPAIIDGARSLTYAEADREINRLASALRDRFGVGPGVSVLLATENRAEYLLTWFALFRLGARAAHAGYRLTSAELG